MVMGNSVMKTTSLPNDIIEYGSVRAAVVCRIGDSEVTMSTATTIAFTSKATSQPPFDMISADFVAIMSASIQAVIILLRLQFNISIVQMLDDRQLASEICCNE